MQDGLASQTMVRAYYRYGRTNLPIREFFSFFFLATGVLTDTYVHTGIVHLRFIPCTVSCYCVSTSVLF